MNGKMEEEEEEMGEGSDSVNADWKEVQRQRQALEERQNGLKMRIGKQRLIVPLKLELSLDEKEIVMNNTNVFKQNGFELQLIMNKKKSVKELENVEKRNDNHKKGVARISSAEEEIGKYEEGAIGVEEEEDGQNEISCEHISQENKMAHIEESTGDGGSDTDLMQGDIYLISVPMFGGSALQLGADGLDFFFLNT